MPLNPYDENATCRWLGCEKKAARWCKWATGYSQASFRVAAVVLCDEHYRIVRADLDADEEEWSLR